MGLRVARTFPRLFRRVGLVAQTIDRPLSRTLEHLQLLGRAARKPT
jgi:hypothetical protein